MLANFTNLASFHNNNFVSTNNRGETMGNNKCCAPLHELIKRLLDVFFAFRIQSTSCLIQKQKRCKSALAIEMRCFWPPDSLLPASPTGVSIQSLRQSFNKWHQVRCASSFLDLRSRCILVTIGNICRYCVIEDE